LSFTILLFDENEDEYDKYLKRVLEITKKKKKEEERKKERKKEKRKRYTYYFLDCVVHFT